MNKKEKLKQKERTVTMNKNESLKMMKMTDYCSTFHCEGVRKHDCGNPFFRVEKILDCHGTQCVPRNCTCHAEFISASHDFDKKEILNEKEILKDEILKDEILKQVQDDDKSSVQDDGKPSVQDNRNRKCAFTLAETLITLTILGVVAAITVPMLINKQMEAANRTKLKKAMAAYEKALNQMIVDNDIKGSIKAWADTVENCGLTNPYFKFINGGNCRFQIADKVWWDISDIEHPVISLKDQLTDAMVTGVKSNSDDYKDDKTLFSMTGEITNGILRINDLADSGLSDNAKANLDKIYAFMNKDGSISTVSGGGDETTVRCTLKEGSETEYSCTGSTLTWKKQTITEEEATAASYTDEDLCNWDPEKNKCDALPNNTSTASEGDLFVSDKLTLTAADAKSAENCASSRNKSYCESYGDYWNLARRKCEAEGGRLPTSAELQVMYNAEQLDGSSYYWAAEASSDNTDDSYIFFTYDGNVYNNGISDVHGKTVCVGK